MGSLLLAPPAAITTNQRRARGHPSRPRWEPGLKAIATGEIHRRRRRWHGHRARRTHPARMAKDPYQARAAANSGRTQIDVHVRMLMPVPGPQAERNPVWDVAPGPAIRASGPWPPRSRPAPPRLPPSRSEPPRPRAPAPCPPRHHAVWGPGAAARPPWRCPWRAPGARAPCVHRYPPISAPHRSPPRLVYAYSRACSRSAPQQAALGSSKYS